jgi:hypothetical protein
MNSDKYPALGQFLGAYLHQDFLDEYGDPDGAITAFLAEAPQDSVTAACNELEKVIPLSGQMDNPEQFLCHVLGCYYAPEADGLTVADWLKRVHNRLCG